MPERGILLVNLGSPDSPSVGDVRRYLREFLMDPRVIDVPWPARFALVHGCILPFRPKVSAEAYAKIWSDIGSPLIALSRNVQEKLRERLEIPVELGMRYQNPGIEPALRRLLNYGVKEVLVVPLFPHHAKSSYESAVERAREIAAKIAPLLRLNILPPYYDKPEYINALAASAAPWLERDYDHLLISFHGVPERHLTKANPGCRDCLGHADCASGGSRVCYRRHCLATVREFVAAANPRRVSFAFQSRLGMDEWLKPATHNEVLRLAAEGVRKLVVMCPAFTVDCLETLEEIGMRARQAFLDAGGEEFNLIPCLNDHPAWVEGLARLIGESRGVRHPAFAPSKLTRSA